MSRNIIGKITVRYTFYMAYYLKGTNIGEYDSRTASVVIEEVHLSGRLRAGVGEAEMGVGLWCGAAAARSPGQISLLHEEGFVDVLYGHGFLVDGGGQGVQADRTAAVIEDDPLQQAPVHGVQTFGVDLQPVQGEIRRGLGAHAVAGDLGVDSSSGGSYRRHQRVGRTERRRTEREPRRRG